MYYQPKDRTPEEDIPAELHETKGTMHGFDTKVKAPTTQRMLKLRTAFMKKMFWNDPADAEAPHCIYE